MESIFDKVEQRGITIGKQEGISIGELRGITIGEQRGERREKLAFAGKMEATSQWAFISYSALLSDNRFCAAKSDVLADNSCSRLSADHGKKNHAKHLV